MKIIYITSIALLLSSCATMTKDECLVADWNRIGYQDAIAGKPVTLAGHSKACAKVSIRPNTNRYMQGYDSGARIFCTYDNGLMMGEKGKSVSRICTAPELRDEFNSGYQRGITFYNKQTKINKKKRQIVDIEKKIETVKASKAEGSIKEIDLLYREKELMNKELSLLTSELNSLKNY